MLPQSHFIAGNYKVQTFFKPRGETLPQCWAIFLSSRSKINSAGYGGPYEFSTNNSVPLLIMMLLKLGNWWNLNQIKLLIFTVH